MSGGTCVEDVDPVLDQIKFQNIAEGTSFIVNGYINSGAVSSISYLTGGEFYTGNLYNGRAFGAVDDGDIGAFEQTATSNSEYYMHPTADLVSIVVNPDTDQVFASKDFLTGQVYKYNNASLNTGSDSTEAALTGISGEPRSWKDAADSSTGYNSIAVLRDGVTHIVSDLDSGAAVDPDADGQWDSRCHRNAHLRDQTYGRPGDGSLRARQHR